MKSRKLTQYAPRDLVAGYLPLVEAAAARFRQHVASQTELDGLTADGLLALHDAANRCVPNKPVRFAIYAKQRIRGAIIDRLKKQHSAPGRFRKPQNAIQTTAHEGNFENEFGMMLGHLEKALAAHGDGVTNRRKEPRGGADPSAPKSFFVFSNRGRTTRRSG